MGDGDDDLGMSPAVPGRQSLENVTAHRDALARLRHLCSTSKFHRWLLVQFSSALRSDSRTCWLCLRNFPGSVSRWLA